MAKERFKRVAMLGLGLGMCLMATACQTPGVPVIASTAGTIGGIAFSALLPQFSSTVAAVCGFEITVASATGFTGSYPDIQTAAQAFCDKATGSVTARRGGVASVNFNGARIQGHFVTR
jgi:hypothetical protein